MDNLERRFFEFEHRADGNRLVGVAVRYGDTYKSRDFHETIARGAFYYDDVILNIQHDRDKPIARTGGSGLEIRSDADALRIEATIPETPFGVEALAMVRAGLLRGFSVEMRIDQESWDEGTSPPARNISRALLYGVGVVDKPAYPDSKVAMRALNRKNEHPPIRPYIY